MATTSPTRRSRGTRGRNDEAGANLPVVAAEVVQGEVVVDQSSAVEVESRIKAAKRKAEAGLWELSEALWEFDQQQGWAALGYENLSRWLADPEIDITRGSYYRFVRTWQKLAVEKGITRPQLEQVSMSKAALVADEVAGGSVRPATALKDASQLSASELRAKYDKPKRGRPAKTEIRETHSPSTALRAAADLPWDWMEEALHGKAPLNLRQARLKEALQAFIDWRSNYLVN